MAECYNSLKSKKIMHKNIVHCCKSMDLFLEDSNIPILYSPIYREYSIPLLYKARTRGQITALQCIMYCPWCDTKLPDSVRNKWFEVLEKEYNIDSPFDRDQEELIPSEFITDEWWKKRNL